MTRIHVLGGTGYAGSRIVREAAKRGHQVVSYSRSIPDKQTRASSTGPVTCKTPRSWPQHSSTRTS